MPKFKITDTDGNEYVTSAKGQRSEHPWDEANKTAFLELEATIRKAALNEKGELKANKSALDMPFIKIPDHETETERKARELADFKAKDSFFFRYAKILWRHKRAINGRERMLEELRSSKADILTEEEARLKRNGYSKRTIKRISKLLSEDLDTQIKKFPEGKGTIFAFSKKVPEAEGWMMHVDDTIAEIWSLYAEPGMFLKPDGKPNELSIVVNMAAVFFAVSFFPKSRSGKETESSCASRIKKRLQKIREKKKKYPDAYAFDFELCPKDDPLEI